ncbi:MAG TPA: ABC transporter permease [Vicinamibacterales bacterium]|nr:ABC transporter permease [Vicinamibacterales bacterium]
MSSVRQDLRHATRVLLKNPGTTAIMVLTLALGTGPTTAIFSVVYGVLLRPLPYPQAERIMSIWEVNSKGRPSHLADPNFDDFRDQNRSFQRMGKYTSYDVPVSVGSQPARTTFALVTPEFFRVFQIQPLMGRDFSDGDNVKGAAPTAIVSYGLWREFLGSSTDLAHTFVKIENVSYAVVGVMPPGFQFPTGAQLWVPADLKGENASRTSHNYSAVGRLRDGISVQQAHAEISGIARHIHASSSEQNDYLLVDGMVLPLQDSLTGATRTPLMILLGAVAFLLLVACANVANLLLAQASARERELAIRSALGAARWRLLRQFLTEAFLLSLAGGALGVLGAIWGVASLVSLAPHNLPRAEEVAVDVPVLAFAVGLTTLVAVGLGAFTAWRATHGDLRKSLVEGGRGQSGTYGSQRAGRIIVASQIAITMTLVTGAALLGRSLMNVLQVDPGFRTDGILAMDVSLPLVDQANAKTPQRQFYSTLLERLGQVPGVKQVGATSALPLDGGLPDGLFLLMAQNEVPKDLKGLVELFRNQERQGEADFGVATTGYFQMLGIPLVRGRLFDERDGPDTPPAALISEALARRRWPGQDPIGQTIEFGNMDSDLRLLTIVGIVKDVRDYGLDLPPRPTVYVNLFQRPRPVMTIAMLTGADVRSVTATARGIVHELNPDVAPRFRTFQQIYSASLGSRAFNLILIGVFALTALLLATAGVFGVMAYTVRRRTQEIGVRVALGANSGQVLGMILGQGMRTALIGIVIGVAGALAMTRTLDSMLFGIQSNDPLTFASVTLLLGLVALLACYLPARRAATVDPMVALRYE